jgi:hypothetical protein
MGVSMSEWIIQKLTENETERVGILVGGNESVDQIRRNPKKAVLN